MIGTDAAQDSVHTKKPVPNPSEGYQSHDDGDDGNCALLDTPISTVRFTSSSTSHAHDLNDIEEVELSNALAEWIDNDEPSMMSTDSPHLSRTHSLHSLTLLETPSFSRVPSLSLETPTQTPMSLPIYTPLGLQEEDAQAAAEHTYIEKGVTEHRIRMEDAKRVEPVPALSQGHESIEGGVRDDPNHDVAATALGLQQENAQAAASPESETPHTLLADGPSQEVATTTTKYTYIDKGTTENPFGRLTKEAILNKRRLRKKIASSGEEERKDGSETGKKRWGFCEICKASFHTRQGLATHIKTQKHLVAVRTLERPPEQKMLLCHWKGCDRSFLNLNVFRDHVSMHAIREAFPPRKSVVEGTRLRCRKDGCSETFSAKYPIALIRHELLHAGIDTYKTHPCDLCSEMFQTRALLSQHEMDDHIATMVPPLADGSGYACQKCNYSCKRKDMALLHIRKHRMNMASRQSGLQSLDKKISLSCSVCDSTFQSKRLLAEHETEAHLNPIIQRSADGGFACTLCLSGWKCERRHRALAHLEVHRKKSKTALVANVQQSLAAFRNGDHSFGLDTLKTKCTSASLEKNSSPSSQDESKKSSSPLVPSEAVHWQFDRAKKRAIAPRDEQAVLRELDEELGLAHTKKKKRKLDVMFPR